MFLRNFSELLQSELQIHKGRSFIYDTGNSFHDSSEQALGRQMEADGHP